MPFTRPEKLKKLLKKLPNKKRKSSNPKLKRTSRRILPKRMLPTRILPRRILPRRILPRRILPRRILPRRIIPIKLKLSQPLRTLKSQRPENEDDYLKIILMTYI